MTLSSQHSGSTDDVTRPFLSQEAAGDKEEAQGTGVRPTRNRSAVFALAASATLLLVLVSLAIWSPLSHSDKASKATDYLNSTLGFGKIYALGLKDRHTRRDDMVLMGLAANLDFTFVDAVDGSLLTNQSLPFQSGGGAALRPGELGCWRTHVNTWRQMLDDGVETALVVEDDLDFDVEIRTQLLRLRPALAQVQGLGAWSAQGSQRALPGDWEILWLGHCNEKAGTVPAKAGAPPRYFAYADDTIPAPSDLYSLWGDILTSYGLPAPKTGPRKTRVVQRSVEPWCTVGYALSRRGATRLYYKLTRELKASVDMEMAWKTWEFKSYSVVPPIMAQWKIVDGVNSDLRPDGTGKKPWNPSVGYVRDLRKAWTMRTRLGKLIDAL